MDNFLLKPSIASEFAHENDPKRNHSGYINEDHTDDDDSFVLSPCQCEKTANNDTKVVDSSLAIFTATQHTLSTFCSTLDDNDDDDDFSGCWDDDEVSLGSFNEGYLFDCQPLNMADVAEHDPMSNMNYVNMNQPMEIAFNKNAVKGNIQGELNEQMDGDDLALFHHYSQESMLLSRGATSHGSTFQQQDMMLAGSHGECSTKQGFNDSMTSLSEAFEKLDYCMLRTAQSRKLVRQLTEKLAMSSSATLPCTTATATSTTAAALKSTTAACPILRSNSMSSLTGTGSVSSKSSRRKGPKSFHKSRRQGHKTTLANKTGVAMRTLLNASFS